MQQKGQDNESQQKIWEEIAEKWHLFKKKPVLITEEKAKEWKPGKIIDIGCGNCRNLLPFAKAGFDCYGVDFSKKMVDFAKSYLKQNKLKATVIAEKAEKLPYKDESFDYCLMLKVLPCIDSAEKRNTALDEMMRVLKKHGKAIITIWNKRNFKYFLSKKEVLVPFRIKNKEEKVVMRYYYLYAPAEIQKVLKEKGFTILSSSNPFMQEYYIIVQKD